MCDSSGCGNKVAYFCVRVINNILPDDTSLQGYDVMSVGEVTDVLEVASFFRTLVTVNRSVWHHITGNWHLHQHCSENHKSCNILFTHNVSVEVGVRAAVPILQ